MRGWRVGWVLLAAVACDDHLLGIAEEVAVEEPVYACDWGGVQELFASRCDACHTRDEEGEPRSGGVVLVEVIEAELADGGGLFVVPGDPEASVLWQSLIGSGTAPIMPYGFTEPLEPALIDHVACWIAEGAPL